MINEEIDFPWIYEYEGEEREVDGFGNPVLEVWEGFCFECGEIGVPDEVGHPFWCNKCKRNW